jgi:predicted metal-dependent hydrolase
VTEPPPEPSLTDDEKRLFQQGVHEFNTGCFFECHETLEDLWGGVRGTSRDFFQGLIQTSTPRATVGSSSARCATRRGPGRRVSTR